jgi:hypothetical protein
MPILDISRDEGCPQGRVSEGKLTEHIPGLSKGTTFSIHVHYGYAHIAVACVQIHPDNVAVYQASPAKVLPLGAVLQQGQEMGSGGNMAVRHLDIMVFPSVFGID